MMMKKVEVKVKEETEEEEEERRDSGTASDPDAELEAHLLTTSLWWSWFGTRFVVRQWRIKLRIYLYTLICAIFSVLFTKGVWSGRANHSGNDGSSSGGQELLVVLCSTVLNVVIIGLATFSFVLPFKRSYDGRVTTQQRLQFTLATASSTLPNVDGSTNNKSTNSMTTSSTPDDLSLQTHLRATTMRFDAAHRRKSSGIVKHSKGGLGEGVVIPVNAVSWTGIRAAAPWLASCCCCCCGRGKRRKREGNNGNGNGTDPEMMEDEEEEEEEVGVGNNDLWGTSWLFLMCFAVYSASGAIYGAVSGYDYVKFYVNESANISPNTTSATTGTSPTNTTSFPASTPSPTPAVGGVSVNAQDLHLLSARASFVLLIVVNAWLSFVTIPRWFEAKYLQWWKANAEERGQILPDTDGGTTNGTGTGNGTFALAPVTMSSMSPVRPPFSNANSRSYMYGFQLYVNLFGVLSSSSTELAGTQSSLFTLLSLIQLAQLCIYSIGTLLNVIRDRNYSPPTRGPVVGSFDDPPDADRLSVAPHTGYVMAIVTYYNFFPTVVAVFYFGSMRAAYVQSVVEQNVDDNAFRDATSTTQLQVFVIYMSIFMATMFFLRILGSAAFVDPYNQVVTTADSAPARPRVVDGGPNGASANTSKVGTTIVVQPAVPAPPLLSPNAVKHRVNFDFVNGLYGNRQAIPVLFLAQLLDHACSSLGILVIAPFSSHFMVIVIMDCVRSVLRDSGAAYRLYMQFARKISCLSDMAIPNRTNQVIVGTRAGAGAGASRPRSVSTGGVGASLDLNSGGSGTATSGSYRPMATVTRATTTLTIGATGVTGTPRTDRNRIQPPSPSGDRLLALPSGLSRPSQSFLLVPVLVPSPTHQAAAHHDSEEEEEEQDETQDGKGATGRQGSGSNGASTNAAAASGFQFEFEVEAEEQLQSKRHAIRQLNQMWTENLHFADQNMYSDFLMCSMVTLAVLLDRFFTAIHLGPLTFTAHLDDHQFALVIGAYVFVVAVKLVTHVGVSVLISYQVRSLRVQCEAILTDNPTEHRTATVNQITNNNNINNNTGLVRALTALVSPVSSVMVGHSTVGQKAAHRYQSQHDDVEEYENDLEGNESRAVSGGGRARFQDDGRVGKPERKMIDDDPAVDSGVSSRSHPTGRNGDDMMLISDVRSSSYGHTGTNDDQNDLATLRRVRQAQSQRHVRAAFNDLLNELEYESEWGYWTVNDQWFLTCSLFVVVLSVSVVATAFHAT